MKINGGTGEHPQWCDRDHNESWTMHSGVIGEVLVLDGAVEVVLTQRADQAPAVTIYRHDPTGTVVDELTPDHAEGLGGLLLRAAAELGGAR